MRSLEESVNKLRASLCFDFKPVSPSTPVPNSLALGLLLLIVCKLILTSQEEMLAFNRPYDDLWQVRAAARAYWGGAYEATKLYHLPVFPLFMELLRIIGMPLRLAFEILYCGAAALLIGALWRFGVPVSLSILAAAVLIFQPASYQLPNKFGAEILLTPLMMGAIASSLWWWMLRDRPNSFKYVVFAGIWWALAWNVRKESIVIVPIFAVMLLFAVVSDRNGKWIKSATAIALMLCFCLALETTIKTVNWSRWGLFATSVHTAPGFRSAIKSLQSIQPEPYLAFIPVPSEVRLRAYPVSPAFMELKPYLEGDFVRKWAVKSRTFTDTKNVRGLSEHDVAAGWFYWVFYEAVVASGHGSDPGEADRFLAKIGEEVRGALSDGRLPGRWVPMAMLDPSWSAWLPRLPESLHRVGGTFLKPAVPERPLINLAVEEVYGEQFDVAATRRLTHLVFPRFGKAEISGWSFQQAEVVGWSYASRGTVQAIEILSGSGSLLGRSALDIPRPDVDTSRSVGFRVPLDVPTENDWLGAKVGIVLEDGRVVRKPLAEMPLAQIVSIPIGETVVYIGLNHVLKPEFSGNVLWNIQAYLESLYLTLLSWLLWPGFMIALAVIIFAARRSRDVDFAIAVIAVAVLTRILFFSVIDASAWPGDQPRYLYPAYPLFSLVLLLVYYRFVSLFAPLNKDELC